MRRRLELLAAATTMLCAVALGSCQDSTSVPGSEVAPATPTLQFGATQPLPYPTLPRTAGCTPRSEPVVPRLQLRGTRQVDPRTTELDVASQALNADAKVDVMLPEGFDRTGRTRYPVLYLLHGHGADHSAWPANRVAAFVGAAPVIVVMPDGGYDGFYADWYGVDSDGHTPTPPPAWETFHIAELIPYIDQTYPTRARREGRAVAGLSMGGFGALSYAARHPELFVAAGSFSGIADPDIDYPNGTAIVALANITDRHPADRCIFGDPLTQDVVWRDHDPTELASNFRSVSLYVACGNGRAAAGVPADQGEAVLYDMNRAFDSSLTSAGIAHVTDFYGPGTHSWQYWAQDLRRFLPQMLAAFATPPPAPPAHGFTYRSASASFSAWGWQMSVDGGATSFTYFTVNSSTSLTVAGQGVAHVATAPQYRPGATYAIARAGQTPTSTAADASGRLHFDVALGPPASSVQTVFGAAAEAQAVSVAVTITGS